jgi:hypothetical protein
MDTDISLELIRELNDKARRHLTDGSVVFSSGIAALPKREQAAILQCVCNFEDFTPDNDPYGEHDFGAFEHNGERIVWKLDYLDEEGCFASQDPADPVLTTRVLTIMLAGEY